VPKVSLCILMVLLGFAFGGRGVIAQTAQAARATGDVTQVQPGRLTVHTQKGDVQVQLADGVKILRVPPGSKDLTSATPITADEVASGDRAVVLGHLGDDQQTIQAVRIVVMSKSDLSSFHAAEVREWQTRGVEGMVKSVDAAQNTVTIAVPNRPPTPGNLTHPVVVTTTAKTVLLRYAPDSVEFAEAKPTTFSAIKVGDQLRALGTKSDDGSQYAADKLVFGTFHNMGATVLSIDPQADTLTVKNLTTGKPVVVHANADCKMHELPPFLAQTIARLTTGGTGAGGAPPSASGNPDRGNAAAGGGAAGGGAAGGGGGARRGGMGDLSQALARMPAITLSDIKRGDPVVIFSSEGANPSEVTAIFILTGVEPILAAQPKGGGEMNLGAWNLSLGGGEGGGEGGP
jgi:hypothetical protein